MGKEMLTLSRWPGRCWRHLRYVHVRLHLVLAYPFRHSGCYFHPLHRHPTLHSRVPTLARLSRSAFGSNKCCRSNVRQWRHYVRYRPYCLQGNRRYNPLREERWANPLACPNVQNTSRQEARRPCL